MSGCCILYRKLEVPTDWRGILESAKHPFYTLLGKTQQTDCCEKVQKLDIEHRCWAQQATAALEAADAQKPDEKKSHPPLALRQIDWIPLSTKALILGLAIRGLTSLVTPFLTIQPFLITIFCVVTPISYAFFSYPKTKTPVSKEVSNDVQIRAKAELSWIRSKIDWLDEQLKQAHMAIATEIPTPAEPVDLKAYIKQASAVEILELTTLKTYFQELLQQRY